MLYVTFYLVMEDPSNTVLQIFVIGIFFKQVTAEFQRLTQIPGFPKIVDLFVRIHC